jgi:phospholipid transport system substrate-binding protein
MDKFKALLEENIVRNYAWRFRNYNGQQLRLLGVRDANRDSTIVETEVEQTGDTPPIRVDWRVHQKDGQYKVIDIVVEGISMMVTQRDEYVGYMRSNGGIDALLEALRKQNAALADRNQG